MKLIYQNEYAKLLIAELSKREEPMLHVLKQLIAKYPNMPMWKVNHEGWELMVRYDPSKLNLKKKYI